MVSCLARILSDLDLDGVCSNSQSCAVTGCESQGRFARPAFSSSVLGRPSWFLLSRFVSVSGCGYLRVWSRGSACVCLAHENAQPSVASNLASHAALRPDLEAHQIRRGELDLINLVKVLMPPALVSG